MLNKFLALVLMLTANSVVAGDSGAPEERLTLMFSPYVFHFNNDSSHNPTPFLVGVEWSPGKGWVDLGAAYFRNSFYQDSAYAYIGKRWFYPERDSGVFLKLTGGLIFGYRGQYETKVPFNRNGVALAIIPAIGYQYQAANVQLVILGRAAVMLTFGYDLWN